MNATKVVEQQVEDYVDAVGRALDGLDADDREAILDDVREHAMSILADQPDVDLTQQLGSPQAFARELLESAGIPTRSRSRWRDWRSSCEQMTSSRVGRALVRARTDFAPAWAVLRGIAVTWLAIHLIGDGRTDVVPWLLAAGGVAGWLLSARYQTLVKRVTAGRLLRYAADILTTVVCVLLFSSWVGSLTPGSNDYTPVEPVGAPGLTQNGSQVFGIQSFAPDGKPTLVALFDQDGAPIATGGMTADNLSCKGDLIPIAVPYLNGAGQPITNAYPARGVCVTNDDVVMGVASMDTHEAPVQAWTVSSLPAVGQRILIDNGSYAGLDATGGAGTASPGGSAVAPPPPAPGNPTPTLAPGNPAFGSATG